MYQRCRSFSNQPKLLMTVLLFKFSSPSVFACSHLSSVLNSSQMSGDPEFLVMLGNQVLVTHVNVFHTAACVMSVTEAVVTLTETFNECALSICYPQRAGQSIIAPLSHTGIISILVF